jgi:archaellum biogenesis ATPase FlaH
MTHPEYLPPDHKPHAEPIKRLYWEAHGELLAPAAAVELKQFKRLQLMTGGLRPREFTILCGATGTGKTTLCANLSADLLEQKVPHFVASVETGHTDYVKRMISVFAGKDWNTGEAVPLDALRQFDSEHGEKFQSDHFWLSLYDDRVSVETLMADLAHMVEYNKTKVAIIDNLNFFLDVTNSRESIVEMDRVIHELIIFCKKVPIHIVMVMHPRKTECTRVESEYDIKGSSTAVQEAHNVLLLNRPHPDLIKSGTADANDRELMIAKMRRRGKFVRRRLILKAKNSVQYQEGDVV